jgi:hypothetical protein
MIRNPGSFVAGFPTDEEAWTVGNLLRQAADGLAESALALEMFNQAYAATASSMAADRSPVDEWRARRDAYSAMREEVAVATPHPALPPGADAKARYEASRERDEQIELEVARRYWAQGHVPSEYQHRVPFMHARSFLFAMDNTAKALGVLIDPKKITLPSPADTKVAAQLTLWEQKFPHVEAVRNSAHHAEDRIRGKKTGEKDIQLQPVTNGMVHAPHGGVTILSGLHNNRYGETMADGHYGEVEVSAATLTDATSIVQAVYDSFDWSGHAHWTPRAF